MQNRANEHYPLNEDEQDEIIKGISEHLKGIMSLMGIDIENDHNSCDSPHRIAKSWVNDLMKGRFNPAPSITSFPNHAHHNQMVMCGPIRVVSICSHHWSPFIGEAFVAYIPHETVIGLSKLSRIVDFYARRPQIQEELTQQIANHLDSTIPDNRGIAVLMTSAHQCMTCRGVGDSGAKMTTSEVRGAFFDDASARKEFFDLCSHSKGVI